MPGTISTISHGGLRSELLAQYVFMSWGTAVAVANPEDHGIDLNCTLTEQTGKRLRARYSYTVQVKSNMDPWEFKGLDAVRWLVEHPLPLFLCVVDKRSLRLRVYQTSPRFHLWASGSLPERLLLIPSAETESKCLDWKKGDRFSLLAPILDFTVQESLQDGFNGSAKRVLEAWLSVENANLDRRRNGICQFDVPVKYKANEPPDLRGRAIYYNLSGDEAGAQLGTALRHLKESLEFVGCELYKQRDIRGALLTVLLHRHLFPGKLHPCLILVDSELRLGKDADGRIGLQRLEYAIDQALAAEDDRAMERTE